MKDSIDLSKFFSATDDNVSRRLEVFALLGLGIVDSLENGVIAADEAVTMFFHATNGKYVRDHLPDKLADEFMSRGVQLPDLFDVLPPEEATEEYRAS